MRSRRLAGFAWKVCSEVRILIFTLGAFGPSAEGSAHWTGAASAHRSRCCMPPPAGHAGVFSHAPLCNAASYHLWHHSTAWDREGGLCSPPISPRQSPSAPTFHTELLWWQHLSCSCTMMASVSMLCSWELVMPPLFWSCPWHTAQVQGVAAQTCTGTGADQQCSAVRPMLWKEALCIPLGRGHAAPYRSYSRVTKVLSR